MFVMTGVLSGCAEEPLPPSVDEFISNKILLDAAMAKCAGDRARLKYTPECVNAREASNRIAKFKEDERRKVLEAQSERKRAALRRAQMAAAEARRRAEEAARRREEAEYLGVFEPAEREPVELATEGGAPQAEFQVPAESGEMGDLGEPGESSLQRSQERSSLPSQERSIEPSVTRPIVSGAPAGTDLKSIREELERRRRSQ